MTNSWRSSALECACAAMLAAVAAGCSDDGGAKALADARAAFEVRDFAKAEKGFLARLEKAPEDVGAWVMLTRTRLEGGKIPEAKEAVAKAAALAADDADVLLLGAQIAYHQKDYAAAVRGFRAVAENAKLDATLRGEGWAGLGVVEYTCNEHAAARVDFLKAIRTDRRNASAYYHLGLLYRDAFGYPEAALEQFDIFVRLEPVADARVQKVQRSYVPELREAIARRAMERPGASKRDSTASAKAIAEGDAFLKKKDNVKARKAYEKALAADPLSYPAALALAKLWDREAATASREKALGYYQTACALRPGAVSTYLTTGALAAKLGRTATAIEVYSRAMAADPTKLDAIDGLIRALQKAGPVQAKAAKYYQDWRNTVAKPRR